MSVLILCVMNVLLFFFFKQKTAYEMRISDWSSDVCSSDLRRKGARRRHTRESRPATGGPRDTLRIALVRHCRPRESLADRSDHTSRASTLRRPGCCRADHRDHAQADGGRAAPPKIGRAHV